MRPLVWLLFVVALSVKSGATQPKDVTVCDLTKSKVSTNQSIDVRLTGEISADKHRIVLTDPGCTEGIYVVHKWGQPGQVWSKFDDDLLEKRSPEEKRRLFVRLVGRFSMKNEDGELFRVLDVTRVEFCEFDREPPSDAGSQDGFLSAQPGVGRFALPLSITFYRQNTRHRNRE